MACRADREAVERINYPSSSEKKAIVNVGEKNRKCWGKIESLTEVLACDVALSLLTLFYVNPGPSFSESNYISPHRH